MSQDSNKSKNCIESSEIQKVSKNRRKENKKDYKDFPFADNCAFIKIDATSNSSSSSKKESQASSSQTFNPNKLKENKIITDPKKMGKVVSKLIKKNSQKENASFSRNYINNHMNKTFSQINTNINLNNTNNLTTMLQNDNTNNFFKKIRFSIKGINKEPKEAKKKGKNFMQEANIAQKDNLIKIRKNLKMLNQKQNDRNNIFNAKNESKGKKNYIDNNAQSSEKNQSTKELLIAMNGKLDSFISFQKIYNSKVTEILLKLTEDRNNNQNTNNNNN